MSVHRCRICGEEIRFVQGVWVDTTYDEVGLSVSLGFAGMCEDGDMHAPELP